MYVVSPAKAKTRALPYSCATSRGCPSGLLASTSASEFCLSRRRLAPSSGSSDCPRLHWLAPRVDPHQVVVETPFGGDHLQLALDIEVRIDAAVGIEFGGIDLHGQDVR